ncbi:MAG: PAS domain S-box protein [Syntrophales bacterium]|jgi:PAS domain S-box-containing protein|nr:PAS domain S-box protein [Syntrophales bacterium]MCK9527646.1 PAS domain S-box protein [Syntrophales bacterium]MDX9922263.1 PAS domain S-box protein [Syntrophales bacterium]
MADRSKTTQDPSKELSLLEEQEALRERAARYRLLAEEMTDVVWIRDLDLRVIYVSPSIEKMLGFTPEEWGLQSIADQLTPASLSLVYDTLARELALEKQAIADPDRTVTIESEYYHKDGSTRWGETLISGIRNDQGALAEIHGVTRDTTGRKWAEEESRKKDRTISAFFDAVQESMVLINPEGIVLLSNTSASRRLGKELQEFQGTCLYDHFPRETATRRKYQYDKVIATGKPVFFEDTREGRTFDQRCYPVFDDEDRVTGVAIFAREVTDLHLAHEALRESEEKYRTLFEESHDAILSVSPAGQVLEANPAACALFGRSIDEIRTIGRNKMVDDSDPRLAAVLEEQERNGLVANAEVTLVRATGETFPAEVSSKPFTDRRGRHRACMIVRDISERKKLEAITRERLIRLNKLAANTPGIIYQFMRNPDGTYRIPFATESIRNIFHCTPDDVRESFAPIMDVVVPEDRDMLLKSIESSAKDMRDWGCEFRVRIPGGGIRWIMGKATPEHVPDGGTLWHGFAGDITEKRESQEILRIAVKRLEALWNVTLLPADDMAGVADQIIMSITDLTESPLAFFGYLNTDESVMTVHSFSEKARRSCFVINEPTTFPVAGAGLWAEAIRTRRPLIVNDLTAVGHLRGGFPEGHVVLRNLMIVPGLSRGKITAIVAVANKAADYDDQDANLVVSFLGNIESIVESKNAQEVLKRSEHNFRQSLEDSPFGVRIVSNEGDTLYVNRAFLDIFGYDSSSEEVSPAPLYTMKSLEEREVRREKRRSGIAGREEYEIEIMGENGTTRHLQVWRKPVLWNGKGQFQVLYEDITARKQAVAEREQAWKELGRSQDTLSSIIEFLPDPTMVIDNEGRIIAWNRAIEALTGTAKEDMLGKNDSEYALPFYGDRRPMLIDIVLHPELEGHTDHSRIGWQGDTLYGEALTPALSKQGLYLTATASALRDAEGTVIGAIECFRDETERINLETQLQQSEKLTSLTRISAGVAHEILNPVGIMSVALQIVGHMKNIPPHVSDKLNVCMNQIDRIVAITDNLKELSRPETQHDMIPEDINDVISRVITVYGTQMKIEGVMTDVLLDPSLPAIPLNRKRIEQVLINLFSNAMAAMEKVDHKLLTIETKKYQETSKGTFLRIVVSDTGTGIEKKNIRKIFEPFYTTRSQGKGMGLGLSISHAIIQQHNGSIWAENNEWGGSTFIIQLPVKGNTHAASQPDD